MPVALAGIAAVMLGLLAVLASMALDWLIKVIAKALPTIGFSFAKLDFGSIFLGIANPVLGWAVDAGKGFYSYVGNWAIGHAYILDDLMFHTVSAITHLGDQIAQIVNAEIPAAIKKADSDATSALLAAAGKIETDIKAASADLGKALSSADASIYKTITGDVATLKDDIKSAVASGVTAAEDFAGLHIADLKSYTDAQVKAAREDAAKALAELKTTIGTEVSKLATQEQTDATNIATLTTQESALQTTLNALKSTVSTQGTELSAAQSQVTTLTTDTTNLSTALTADQTADQSAIGSLQTEGTTLTNDILNQAQTFGGDLTDLSATLKAAITAAVGTLALRVSAIEECYVGVCDDSPNNFSNLLNDALGVAEFAGVFAFLSQVVSNPAGAEADYSGVIEGLYQSGDSLFHSLLNL